MKKNTQLRRLEKMIRPYGLDIEFGDHNKIVNRSGQPIYWFSGSASCEYWADNTVRDLVKLKYIPKECKKIRIR